MTQPAFQVSSAEELRRSMLSEMQSIMGEAALELVGELAPMFLEDAPPLLAALEAATAQNNATQLREAAHTLKGSSGSMGLHRLSQLAYEMEQLGRDNRLTLAPAKLQHILAEYAVVQQVLQGFST